MEEICGIRVNALFCVNIPCPNEGHIRFIVDSKYKNNSFQDKGCLEIDITQYKIKYNPLIHIMQPILSIPLNAIKAISKTWITLGCNKNALETQIINDWSWEYTRL